MAAIACGIVLLAACTTSPTGRGQLQLYPDDQMEQMGAASFKELKQQQEISDDPQAKQLVRCVTNAITQVVGGDTEWEVVVFEDESPNAFALPGGKVGVHTGMLKVADSPAQLAAVIAHEIAHVKAEHGNARLSASTLTQAGLAVTQIMLGGDSEEKNRIMALLGVGAQVGLLLPYSRGQETEADVLGLDYMARAGFDPRASVKLWRNMSEAGDGQPPEFLSTHPAHGSRIDSLQDHMPEAMKLYRKARNQGRTPDCG